ncbi:type II secretion system F family protein [Nesterenkonia aerolata]|uniref:Type II secretion system F family protein n=1 Tax=Nesterenkonia aerolata TaxID=3074079 RepID=A0ABU2DUN9_9MICC|nr:type II secretion system F family protein [Nesterenkonia sp. LY-0111]MDR8020210.1 type II secretion system F family protein [Nesterenkonia sp. LY-0111]
MTTSIAWALVAGLGLGLGTLIVIFSLPVLNEPRLVDRVTPHLRSSATATDLFSTSRPRAVPIGAAGRLFLPVVEALREHVERFAVDSEQLHARLEQADSPLGVADYRLQQLVMAVSAGALAIGAQVMAFFADAFHPLLAVVSVLAAGVLGYGARDTMLTARIRRRHTRMLSEFPTVAEMIALAVSAGESAPGAFERVSRVSRGELHVEFLRVQRQMQAGASFSEALKRMSARVRSAPITRFLEGIIVAMERGTPLAEVMRAQAQDVRDLSKRELMETAGKKEISMMVPLVFGVLPLTVVFAVYPGVELLSIGV